MADATGAPHGRRFGGLVVLFLGLLGVFSALTLTAEGKSGWAASAAIVGVVLVGVGLKLLPRSTP
jgi:hypothetical protein